MGFIERKLERCIFNYIYLCLTKKIYLFPLMTRYRSMVEKAGMLEKGWEPVYSTGDGNCLFNAVSTFIFGEEKGSVFLRSISFIFAMANLHKITTWVCFLELIYLCLPLIIKIHLKSL